MNISAKREYLLTLRNRYKQATSRKDKTVIIDEATLKKEIIG